MSGGMSAMSIATMAMMAAGTAASMISAHNQGEAAKSQANFEANQMQQNANNAAAVASEKVQQQEKQTAYVESNLQASAAGSGGSATDPTVTTDLKTIAGEGRFRSLTDMYTGQAQAQAMNLQAAATRAGGDNAARSGNNNAIAAGITGASSLFNKYNNVDSSAGTNTAPMSEGPQYNPFYVQPA